MARQKPPVHLPSQSQPIMDPATGRMNPAWYGFFYDLTSQATPLDGVTPGASPYTYTAIHPGAMLIIGGTVSEVDLIRGRDTVNTGLTAGFFPMSQNDQLVITYSAAPTLWYVPNGNPA